MRPEASRKGMDESTTERETRRLLRRLMQDAVPPVPRKLNRVGELFGLYLEIAAKNGWPMRQRTERLTLLRLVILQLLAPDIFRFGRYNPTFLTKLESWKPAGQKANMNQIYERIRARIKTLEEKPDDLQATRDLYPLRKLDQPLLTKVREAQRDRNHFDPLNLVDPDNPSDSDLRRYFNLEDNPPAGTVFTADSEFSAGVKAAPVFVAETGAAPPPPEAAVPAAGEMPPQPAPPARRPDDDRPPVAPRDPEGFFGQLFSTDEIAWRNALEQEAENLRGHRLDDASFQMLLDEVRQIPGFVQVEWLELLEPYLTAEQIQWICRESDLLQRLNQAIQEETDGSKQA